MPPDWHLADVWDFVKAGIETVIEKSAIYHGRDADGRPHLVEYYLKYRPEDVYVTLRLKQANLYLAHWDGHLHGFGIVQVKHDPFGNVPPHLLSWIGFCDHRETRVAYFQELKIIAKSFNLSEIRHYSVRHGWLVDAPWGDETETLTRYGWLKHPLDRAVIRGLAASAEFAQRVRI